MPNILGFQSQVVTPAYQTMVRATLPGCLKVIVPGGLDVGLLREWRQQRPDGLLVVRAYFPDEHLAPEKIAAAVAIGGYLKDLNPVLECPINEASQTSPGAIAELSAYSVRFVQACTAAGIRPAVGVFSEGNPSDLGWWPQFYPALAAARGAGGYLALHEYGVPGLGMEDWHLLRHRRVWAALPEDCRVPILVTECGIDGGIEGRREQGWRSYLDAPAYAAWLRRYRQEIVQDAYVHAATIFLCGSGDQWRQFDVTDEVDLRPVFAEPVAMPPRWTPPAPTPKPPEVPMTDIALGQIIPVEEMLSTTHYGGKRATTDLIVIHATRSGITTTGHKIQTEANVTAVYMDNDGIPEANRVSSHLVVGDQKVYRVVHDDLQGWHAGYLNPRSLGIEVAQATPTTPYAASQVEFAAHAAAMYCLKYGIPVRRVMDENQRGIIGHEDSAQGKSYGKSDPGPLWDWGRFMALVAQYAGAPTPIPVPAPNPSTWPNGRRKASTAEYDQLVWAPIKTAVNHLLDGGNGALGDDADAHDIAALVARNERRHGINR